MDWIFSFLFFSVCAALTSAQIQTQQDLMSIAARLKITWTVVTNTKEETRFEAEVTLENQAVSPSLSYGPWEIHFNNIFMIEPDLMGNGGYKEVELKGQGINVRHVQGSHFYFSPTPDFVTLSSGAKRKIKMKISFWSVSRTDVMHNWYITSPGLLPVAITSTQGEELAFVSDKTTVGQWKRYDYDYYNPYTAQERYERNYVPYSTYDSEIRVIPKPADVSMAEPEDLKMVSIDSDWYVGYTGGPLAFVARDYLIGKLSLDPSHVVQNNKPGPKVIYLEIGSVDLSEVNDVIQDSPDAYRLTVNATAERIVITGKNASGVFYGVVTLLGLMDATRRVPECTVLDAPRFEYRGFMLDIARSFHPKSEIIEIVEVMTMYKLNKLHLHLSDDEGWRIEIPALPELTELGSQRCHDPNETVCLMPEIGSGPDNSTVFGSGYLSSRDYVDIIKYAHDRHVTVIPEIDMPGHGRAAIKAMELRLKRLTDQGNPSLGENTTLVEPGDPSKYFSNQMFSDNAINPCQESTYNFIDIVMNEFIARHQEAQQPLTTFHFGGDEVGIGAWVNSTRCQTLKNQGKLPGDSPKWYFFQRVSQLAASKGLSLGAWEDGLMKDGSNPFNLSSSSVKDVKAFAWDNVWEWGTIQRTYTFANLGYKVVMTHASNLYCDHPYEPDPEERGYYWATRTTDTRKAFAYNAVRYYDNFLTRRSGQPVTDDELCGPANQNCPNLTAPENIIGMEGTLFGETTRTRGHLHNQLFPRLLAIAERAWHKAPWEDLPKGEERDEMLNEDWFSFARAIGHRELYRLDQMGIFYRIPPPGGKVSHGRLLTTSLYPKLQVEYSMDAGATWKDAGPSVVIGDYNYRIWLRTRNNLSRYSRTIVLHPTPPPMITNQPIIEYIAQNLAVQYTVVDNYLTYGDTYYVAKLELRNTGNKTIPGGNWKIYFTSVLMVESEYTKAGRMYVDHMVRMEIGHVKGYLHSVGPTSDFVGLNGGDTLEFTFKVDLWSVSRYEQMPRWYVSAPGMTARNLVLTDDESLQFVSPFTKPEQWKRFANDQYDPWTPRSRYDRNAGWAVKPINNPPIIPTPISYVAQSEGQINLGQGTWTLVYEDSSLMAVAQHFNETITTFLPGLKFTLSNTPPADSYIRFRIGETTTDSNSTDAYSIQVNPGSKVVEVMAPTTDGAFYGAVSLIHMSIKSRPQGSLPACEVTDWPRFPYRGMHADTARNFLPKEAVLRLLNAMSLYKLNKLHFHLADDEGWRLEIPGLEELTQLGSQRCHDLEETECIMSTMGSGADTTTSGTGFYSVAEYQEILRYAAARHIEVIPEFDSPGHAHSMIKAMRARETRLADIGDRANAYTYRLNDPEDPSHYFSVQYYTDNAVNPCINSTFSFFEAVYTQVREMHKNIQPLKTFHFGGDEVAAGAWDNSTACIHLIKSGVHLKEVFTRRMAEITREVNLMAWEDGLMDHGSVPWERSLLPNKEVIANTWQNVWEWGAGNRAYNLANAGYKVVFSPVTHMYFDHPQEPSPEERGFYWGTRYTDAFKAFSFMPDDYYLNAEIKRSGEPITLEEICGEDNSGCPPLEKPENIFGLQGQLWAETVRRPEQFEYMVFPRLLTLAERAWHKAAWEGKDKKARDAPLKADWARFAQSLGTNDLAILDKLGVAYRVPPPGARQVQDKYTISTNVEFPGLQVQSKEGSSNWAVHSSSKSYKEGQTVRFRSVSADGTRYSSEVQVKVIKLSSGSGNSASTLGISLIWCMCLVISYCYTIL